MRSILLLILSFSIFAQAERKPFRIHLPDYAWGMSIIQAHDIDVLGVDLKSGMVDILATEWELGMLSQFSATSHFFKKNQLDDSFEMSVYKIGYGPAYKPTPDEGYKTPEEIKKILEEYESKYPKIAKVYVIGHSLEGREILAIKISDNVHRRELKEPTILFNSMHHAREVMTPEVAIDIIDQLLTGYWKNFEATRWVKSNEIWVVPMVNPDGNNKVWTGDKFWRKNTRDGHGVDLNRNYPYDWGNCNGSSENPDSPVYGGEYPASEPETQALMALVESIRPVFDISYHSYSELVIYPFGCDEKKAHQVIEGIGKELAQTIDYEAGTAWELLYSVSGSDIDWMYDRYQVIPYVIELNSFFEGFMPNFDRWRDQTVRHNRAGWQYLLNRLQGPGVRGIVRDRDNNPISDFLVRVELDGSQVMEYRGNPDGTYHIVLGPGYYTFRFTRQGRDPIIKSMQIGKRRKKLNIKFNTI